MVLLVLVSVFLTPAFIPGLVLSIVGHASPAKGLQGPGRILLILGIVGMALDLVFGVLVGITASAASQMVLLF